MKIFALLVLPVLSVVVACSGGGGGSEIPCSDYAVGEVCGGGIYAGEFGSYSLITTPGNCNDSASPNCNELTDTLAKQWATNAASASGATSANDGFANTNTIVAHYAGLPGNDSPAANFCANMSYGGYTDWYLPSENELALLYTNRVSIGGFNVGDYYWSSTEDDSGNSTRIDFSNGVPSSFGKNSFELVRCIRRISND